MASRGDDIEIIQVTGEAHWKKWFICRGNEYLGPKPDLRWSTYAENDGFFRETPAEAEADKATIIVREAVEKQEPPPPP